jgi:hypothetical protein
MKIFRDTVEAAKAGSRNPMNVFLDRAILALWAEQLGLVIEDVRAGSDPVVDAGALGQALCVLRKPA